MYDFSVSAKIGKTISDSEFALITGLRENYVERFRGDGEPISEAVTVNPETGNFSNKSVMEAVKNYLTSLGLPEPSFQSDDEVFPLNGSDAPAEVVKHVNNVYLKTLNRKGLYVGKGFASCYRPVGLQDANLEEEFD